MTLNNSPDVTAVASIDLAVLIVAFVLGKVLDAREFLDRMVFGVTTASLIVIYLTWRIGWTLDSFEWNFSGVWQYGYFAFETLAISYSLMSIAILMRRSDHTPAADLAQANLESSGEWPLVDVFICTYNEPLDVLEKSILLSLELDYPRVQIWVLDDTRRAWLEDYCADVGVHYITRPNNEGAKAGNLNHAWRVTSGAKAGPLILVLDADFAPHANFLKRTVGLFHDPIVGIVQTPQHYFNADPVQHNLHASASWVDDQRIFFDIFQPAKDAWGCAFCVGTSFVVRRELLDEIGGVPTGSVSEDLSLSYALLRRGYVTRWLNEPLSVGLAAEGLPEYVTQRARWCLGTVQAALLPGGTLRGGGLTLMQRLHSFHGLLNWLSKPFILLMLCAPLVYWFAGVPAFNSDYVDFLRFAIPALICFYAYSGWIGHGRTLPVFMEVTHLMTAAAITWTLVTCLYRPFGRPFKVTDKGGDRSIAIIRWKMLSFFGGMTAISIGAILLALIGPDAAAETSSVDQLNLVWAGLSLVLCAIASLVCIERPRRHREELFRSNVPGYLMLEKRVACEVRGLSTTTLLLGMDQSGPDVNVGVGETIGTWVEGVGILGGTVTHATSREIKVGLSLPEAQRRNLLRHLYGSPNDNVAQQAKFGPACLGVIRSSYDRI
jgi:cellulose synthase (UDP-forming)